mgnify:CR=1 FL=1
MSSNIRKGRQRIRPGILQIPGLIGGAYILALKRPGFTLAGVKTFTFDEGATKSNNFRLAC